MRPGAAARGERVRHEPPAPAAARPPRGHPPPCRAGRPLPSRGRPHPAHPRRRHPPPARTGLGRHRWHTPGSGRGGRRLMSQEHAPRSVDHRKRLGLVLAITCTILMVEVVGALLSGSLALVAMWFAARPSSPSRTFGFHRLEILAAVANALVLCGVGVYILVESVLRLLEPPVV